MVLDVLVEIELVLLKSFADFLEASLAKYWSVAPDDTQSIDS